MGGYIITDSEKEATFYGVYFQFGLKRDDLRAEIVWTESPDGQQIFGRLAGTGAELTETTRVLNAQTNTALPQNKAERIKIERFIEPNSDIAVASVVPENINMKNKIKYESLEFFGTVDLQCDTVTIIISFTDHMSSVLAKGYDTDRIFAFDSDFRTLGFTVVPEDTGEP